MDFDHSWKALLRPGEATEYFAINNPKRVQIEVSGYSRINAWWLAELSRLIYKQGSDEIGAKAKGSDRSEILGKVNLREARFFSRNGVECAIVESRNGTEGKFTVLVFRGTHELLNSLK